EFSCDFRFRIVLIEAGLVPGFFVSTHSGGRLPGANA
ncbi:MAG: hypothetical protein ACI82O_002496, partial [Patiriisocius sp.]